MGLSTGTHGVIAIHGISDGLKRGEFLASVSNSLADALLESPAKDNAGHVVYPEVERQMDSTSDPACVTLRITTPDQSANTTWICKEAFWADAFPPPSASTVLRWLIKQMGGQLRYVWNGLFKDPANNKDFNPDFHQTPEETEQPKLAGRFLSTVYWLELLVMGTFLIPLSFIVPILLFLIWPLYWMPRFGMLTMSLDWLHKLDPFLSRSLGDAKRFIEHGVWSASARGILERIVIDMLIDETIKDITIVAHSMGCVVTYDALREGGEIAKAAAELKNGKKITFVSVGSGINQVFRLARNSNTYAQDRLRRPLAKQITGYDVNAKPGSKSLRDKFFWLDIYSRFDPVPAGDLDTAIIKQAQVHPDQVKRRRVINLDNPIRDHSFYWHNKRLVMPRIARAINGGIDYPWPEAGITTKKRERHYKGVASLVALRLLMCIIVVACLVVMNLNIFGTLTFLSIPLPLFIALLVIGLYYAIRSSMFGDIS